MSREYARRSKGGGNLPLIIAIIGTVIVIAVILYFVLSGGGFGGPKATETDTSPVTTPPQTDSPTPGPSLTAAPSPTMALVIPSESPSEVITTAPPTPTPAPTYATATVWELAVNVREGPGLDYAKVGTVKRGDYFKVWEETSKWLKIQMTNGVFGWVWRDYCVRGDAALPAAPTKKPDPSMMKSAVFSSSTIIRVTFTENVWGNSAKTAAVQAAAFEVKEGTSTVAISAITLCQGGSYVDLTVGTTGGGTITVKLVKNGVYNNESKGTTEGTITLGTSTDSVAPTVSMSYNGTDKVIITFTDSDSTLTLDATKVSILQRSGTTSMTINPVVSGKTIEVGLAFPDVTAGQAYTFAIDVGAGAAKDSAGNSSSSKTSSDYSRTFS